MNEEIKKSKRGGPRKGAGRKPVAKGERKVTITNYIQENIIEKLGGKDAVKELMAEKIKEAVIKIDDVGDH